MGQLIVLEGLDGSGKYTQFELLNTKLGAKTLDFPQYDTFWGKQVARYLRGEFGDLDSLPVEVPIMFYALDRYQCIDTLNDWLASGKTVLLNRYTTSSLAFQGAKKEGKEREEIIKWIELIETRLPTPDLVIFLDVPRDFAKELVLKKQDRDYLQGDKRDIHEKNMEYQKKVEEVYKELCEARPNWHRVECVENNKLLSKEQIADKVWSVVGN